ncbi:MAG: type II toxin-antitoxin system HicB family antitoxin [Leptospiraceae bacterium]|nr:type II toxin-antitoxin system HicB family antitoxin [Leptospiraceae bacterium]
MNRDYLVYKNFLGSVHFHTEDEIFYGKIEEIDDLITFEGKSVSELKKTFHEAVDDYLKLCHKLDKPVFKSFKGSFNVRINPELHKKAFRKSVTLGISLNQLVQKAIEKEVKAKVVAA